MIGYPFFLYGLLYRRQINQEQFMRVAFGCALCMFVLALFGVPNWIITILAVATGLSIWKQNFYKYEVVNEVLKHHNKS
jgi:Flp pilus assembly protein TadB